MSEPVVLLKGDDPSLLAEAVSEAIDDALDGEDRALAAEELDGEDLTVGAIVDAATTPPLLTARRVIIVRDIGRFTSEALEPLVEYLRAPLETSALVLVAGGGQTSTRLLNAIKKVGRIVDAATPRAGKARTAWVTERLKAAPVAFDAAAGARIVGHLGEDLGRLPALIDIVESAYGPGAHIGVAEVEPFLGGAGGVAPWDLTDAIDRGDTAASLDALQRLMGSGERHPLVVMGTLHRHYAAMLRLDGSGIRSDTEAAAVLGMAPFPARKAISQAARLGPKGIGRAIELLARADLDLKGLREWPDYLVLEVLVARLSRLATAAGAVTGVGLILHGPDPELAATAEELGYDSLWVRDGGALEAYTVLGAIAAGTTTARLGVLVTDIAGRHPTIVAKQVTAIDVISHGRALLAIGGADTEKVEDALQICRAMFRDEQPGLDDVAGTAFNRPSPMQPGGPPILVGGHLAVAARHADGVVIDGWHEDVDRHLALLAHLCGESGRDLRTLRTIWVPPVGCEPTAAGGPVLPSALDGVIVDLGPVVGPAALAAARAAWQFALGGGR